MRQRIAIVFAICACAGLVPARAHADGFRLAEQSAAALGMASAVSAGITEPAAVWYDPAALPFMTGYQASVTGTAYLAQVTFTPLAGASVVDAHPVRELVPGFFASARVSERAAVGIGVNVPFGLGVEWPNGWVGRDHGLKSSIMMLNVNPVVAFKVLPELSVAVGVDLVHGSVDLTNGLPTSGTDSVRIGGDAWGLGANVAVLYRVLRERFHVAASYRSRVKLPLSGRAHFEIAEPVFSSLLFDQTGTSNLTLPDVITLGVMYSPEPALRIGVDLHAVLWSTFDNVPVRLDNPATPDSGFRPHYHDIVNPRIGAEWATPLAGLKLRAGFEYDPNPAPESGLSPAVPDAQSFDVCLGVGYHVTHFGADLGYMLVLFSPSRARNASDPTIAAQSPEGSYRTSAHVIGLTLTGRLGTEASSSERARE